MEKRTQAIEIIVPGEPQGKGRPRSTYRCGFVQTYTPPRTRQYEKLIRECAETSLQNRSAFESERPLRLELVAVCEIPYSWSKKRQKAALGKYVTKKPDIDNIEKVVMDALNGLVFPDDKQIAETSTKKIYADVPELRIKIEELPND